MFKIVSVMIFITIFLFGCTENIINENDQTGPKEGKILYVAESDFTSGKVEWLADPEKETLDGEFSIYNDFVIKTYKGDLYALERYLADNVVKFGKDSSGKWGKLYQTHIGDNVNPSDIAFVTDTSAFITCLNSDKLTKFNPATGLITGSIDLSSFIYLPETNISPNATAILNIDGILYILLQRLNGYTPTRPSLIVIIDPAKEKITDTIPLKFKNGQSMAYHDGILYVCNIGEWGVTGDGALEAITLSSGEVKTIIKEEKLGGNPTKIIMKSDKSLYLQNYISIGNTAVSEIDILSGKVKVTLPGIKEAYGICYDSESNLLYVGERDKESMGVKVFKDNVQVGPVRKSGNSLPPMELLIVE
ncbi:MAG: hypothetical protein GX640_05155 [Fibrobacter sp.]|nr:hypothetical protein [Fibrobacter sp.]